LFLRVARENPQRHCERSEAIQLRAGRRAEKSAEFAADAALYIWRASRALDCFVATLLAMTVGLETAPRLPRSVSPFEISAGVGGGG
jgi:hypothetical protein